MKKTFLFLFGILLTVNTNAQSFQWAKSLGAGFDDYFTSIINDSYGNSYVTGNFRTTVDMDMGPGVFNITSMNNSIDVFIMKLDSNGNFLWAKKIGDSLSDYSIAITIDNSDNIYVTGQYTSDSMDCDPGPAVSNVYSTNGGSQDVFIVKLNNMGNFIWAKSMGSIGPEWPKSIIVDANKNVYSAGSFSATMDFDPGLGVYNLTSLGQTDAYISKLDSNGNFVWAKQVGGTTIYGDVANCLKLDQNSNLLISGHIPDIADIDPGPGIYYSGAVDTSSLFLIKLDVNGDFMWGKTLKRATVFSIDLDLNQNIILTGLYWHNTDMDPSLGVYYLASYDSSNQSIFILKLDSAGIFDWVKALQLSNAAGGYRPRCVVVGDNNEIYTMGRFAGSLDMDPGAFNYCLSGAPFTIYISALDSSGSFLWGNKFGGAGLGNECFYASIDPTGALYYCGAFEGQNVDFDPSPGVFTLSGNGYSDGFLMKYHYCGENFPININACDFVVVNGITYYSPGNYVQSYAGVDNCDSTLLLNINIALNTYGNIKDTACGSFSFYGLTYFASGIYTQILPNASGCDSIITLNLTIYPINTGVTQNGLAFTANATGNVFYQWIKCNPYQIITGETNQVFTATANGDYAVIITTENCTDTSTCQTVHGVVVDEYQYVANITIYPNPVTKELILKNQKPFQNASIKILDVTGQVFIEKSNFSGRLISVDMSKLLSGIYFVEIRDEGHKYVRTLTKE